MSEANDRDHEVWFGGDYGTWAEASADSTGYDAPEILECVVAATRRVVSGEAAYERDGVTFDRIEHSVPLLAGLFYASSVCGNRLSLVDIGGSLGSSYRQNRGLLSHLEMLRWSVVEQPHFVAAGRAEFETDELRFYSSLEECTAEQRPVVALLSSVLQYVEVPYELLGRVLGQRFEIVIVDRTPFFVEEIPERITVEHVPARIYRADYPSWFFASRTFRAEIARSAYEVRFEADSWERWSVGGDLAQNRCLVLRPRR